MLRNAWLALGGVWVAIVFYLSLTPNPPETVSFDGVDKLEHALAYILLMLWFCQVIVTKQARIFLFIAFVVMGVGIEILQGLSGYRYFEYADMLANTTGVLIGFGLAHTRMGCILMKLERNAKNT